MAVSEDFKTYISDQLSSFGAVEFKKMFGGMGIFKDGLMFGMLAKETFRMKVDDHNRAAYKSHGMKPYHSAFKKKGMPYWEVPPEILDDRELLAVWAQKSYEAAVRAKQ